MKNHLEYCFARCIRLGIARGLAWGLALGMATGLVLAGPASAELIFDASGFQVIGEPYQHTVFHHEFPFTNRGEELVKVREIVDIRGTAEIRVEPREIPPGGSGRFIVQQPLDLLGSSHYRYALITDEADVERYRLTLSAFIQSAYSPENILVDFGFIDPREETLARLELFSREVEALRILRAESPPVAGPRLAGSERIGIAGEGVDQALVWPKGTAQGTHGGSLVLETNVEHQPRIVISYRANVFGRVVPSEHPIDLGLGLAGDPVEKVVTLTSRDRTAIEMERIEIPDGEVRSSLGACPGREQDLSCRRLTLEALSSVPKVLGNELQIFLSGEETPLPLRYQARIVAAGTRIKRIEISNTEAAGEAPAETP
ncbi:MAG: hypothetical protein K0U98_05340 [Deltaproteobacteria bacterium]|nr:hypothetical protein [Deltaproteobacteria bacterium]